MLSLFSNIKEIWGGGASSASSEYSAFASAARAARQSGGVVEGDAVDRRFNDARFIFFGDLHFDYLFPQFLKTLLNAGLIKSRSEL